MKETHSLFHNEEEVLKKAVEVMDKFEEPNNLFFEEYKSLFKAYKKLYQQTKRLVKISDKQQHQLTHLAEGLQSNNVELQHKAQVAEQAVQANEKKLAQFLEAVPIGVFVIDANCTPYYANKTAQKILGKSLVPSTPIQSELNQSSHPSLLDTMPVELKPIVQTLKNKMSNVDNIEIHQGDKIIPIEVWVVPIFDESNNVAYTIAAFQDISERKQAEIERKKFTQALQESEERFRVIAETTPIPLVISRISDGLILYANAQVKNILGLSATELVGRKSIDFYNNHEDRIKLFQLLNQQGYIRNHEVKLKKVDNTVIWVEFCIQPMVFKNEQVLLTTIYDISERKRVEEERIHFTQELAQLNHSYERFVPREFLSLLEKQSIIDVQLGDHIEKEITILFSDIRGFTALSEKMTPHENFHFINEYLNQMEPIMSQNNGIIDKYIGDAIMALFPTCADDAVCGSIAMLKTLAVFNQKRQHLSNISIGIGLNSGPSMLGTIGGTTRMDTTVISDAVNLASRVEELTKIYGTALLITEQTYLGLIDPLQYHIRVIDAVKVKGKSQKITVYEIYDADIPEIVVLKDKTRDEFEEGFVLYHWEEFNDASPFFERVLKINPNDKVAHIYLKRCHNFQKNGIRAL